MRDVVKYLEKQGKLEYANRVSALMDESQERIEHITKKSHALAHELTLLQKSMVELMRRVKTLEEKPAGAVVYQPAPLRADAIGRPFSEELFNPVKGASLQVPMRGASMQGEDFEPVSAGGTFKTFGRSAFDPEPLPHEFKEENVPSRNNLD
jgi:hypothetical protein